MRTRFPDYSIDISNGSLRVMVVVPIALVSGLSEGVQTAANIRKVQEAIRLICDETRGGYVVCSTGQKLVSSVVCIKQYPTTKQATVQIYFLLSDLLTAAAGDADDIAAINAMTANDEFTIEFDWGDTIKDHIPTDYAKETTAQQAATEAAAAKEAAQGINIPTDYAKPSHITAGVNEIKNFIGVAGSDGEGEYQALSMQDIFDMCDDIDTAILGENHPGLVTAEEHAAIIAAIDIDGDTDWDDYVEPSNE